MKKSQRKNASYMGTYLTVDPPEDMKFNIPIILFFIPDLIVLLPTFFPPFHNLISLAIMVLVIGLNLWGAWMVANRSKYPRGSVLFYGVVGAVSSVGAWLQAERIAYEYATIRSYAFFGLTTLLYIALTVVVVLIHVKRVNQGYMVKKRGGSVTAFAGGAGILGLILMRVLSKVWNFQQTSLVLSFVYLLLAVVFVALALNLYRYIYIRRQSPNGNGSHDVVRKSLSHK